MCAFAVGDDLPPHQPNCFGCGPRNQAGLHLRCRLSADGVSGTVRLGRQHEGGPGVAHGGVITAVLDDLLGFLLYRLGAPMVTARLEVDFRRPIGLEQDFEGAGRIVGESGRKVWAEGELRRAGEVYAQARALFVRVDQGHWRRASPGAGEAFEHWSRAGREGDAGPGPVGT